MRRDDGKAKHYYEFSAMGGDTGARHNLAVLEYRARNMDRGIKHLMIAAEFGYTGSLEMIKLLCISNDYEKALRAYQAYLNEIKSPQRDEAAAFHDEYKYY